MKYRNISLAYDSQYSLVKYTDEYKKYLDEILEMDKYLAQSVINGPKSFSIDSTSQSYMIFAGVQNLVGLIQINTSADEKNLEIELELDTQRFHSQEHILDVIEQIVESLKLYFYDKKYIEIKILNDIDLSQYKYYKYSKRIYDEKLTTYICSNEINNILIPRLINEISLTEKNLTNWGESWYQSIDWDELNYFDKELVKSIEDGSATLEELVIKVKSMAWTGITSKRGNRSIEFSRDGSVQFSKISNNVSNGIKYNFSYNLLNNGFNLKYNRGFRKNNLEIEEGQFLTHINMKPLNITYSKDNKRKKIEYVSDVVSNSSIKLELWLNDDMEIENCYVDFRTHKNNGKIKGIYTLRLNTKSLYDKFSIRFISRKGDRYSNFIGELETQDKELFASLMEGKLTLELIDDIIKKLIPIINKKASRNNSQCISSNNEVIISNFIEMENKVINLLKEIKGEIPLPHLQESLELFIINNDKNKVAKKLLLK